MTIKKHKTIERMVDGYTRINQTSVKPIDEKTFKGMLLMLIFILIPIKLFKIS